MISIKFLVLVILLSNIIPNEGLKVEKIQYTKKSSRIGLGEEITLILFDLYFDSKIYMDDGIALKEFSSYNFTWDIYTNKTTGIPICLGRSDINQCPKLPIGLLNIASMFRLECDNNRVISEIPKQGFIVNYPQNGYGGNSLDFVIPFFPSYDPIYSFGTDLGWINDTRLSVVENKLSFVVFNALTKGGVNYNFGLRPTDYSLCNFQIYNTTGYKNRRIVDINNNTIQGLDTTKIVESSPNITCNPLAVQKAQSTISNLTSTLTFSKDWTSLTDNLWFYTWFLLSDEMSNCIKFLDQNTLLSRTIGTVYTSSFCYSESQTPQWLADPCCNPFIYGKSDHCCMSRNISTNIQSYYNISSAYPSVCTSKEKITSLIQDYLVIRNTTTDPLVGCSSSIRDVSKRSLDDQYDALFSCFDQMSPVSCYDDSDCPCSSCNVHSNCFPCTVDNQQKWLTSCFNGSIPQNVESFARALWGLIGASEDVFLSTFYNKTLVPQCVAANGTTLATLKNESSCLANGICRVNSTSFTYNQVKESNCKGENETVGVCEVCSANGECSALPFGDYCHLTDPNLSSYQVCFENYGYSWSEILNQCYFPTYNKSQCNCGTGMSNYTSCLTGYCSVGKDQSKCIFNPETDAAYKYWDPILGECVANIMTRFACRQYSGGGAWVYGKKWIETDKSYLNITKKEDCENLSLCRVNNTIVNGTCDQNNCVGNTYTCKSHSSDPQFICYNASITNSTECKLMQGWWVNIDNICVFSVIKDAATCSAMGLTGETCAGLTNEQCVKCTSYNKTVCPLKGMNALYCGVWSNGDVPTTLPKEQCEEKGYCFPMQYYPGCFYSTAYITSNNCPLCFWGGRTSINSNPQNNYRNEYADSLVQMFEEPHSRKRADVNIFAPTFITLLDRWSAIYGCSYHSVTESQCAAAGGQWLNRLYTKQDCEALKACKEPTSHYCQYQVDGTLQTMDYVTNKSYDECLNCGGSWEPVYQWRAAQYVPVTKFTTRWKTVAWEPSNKFVPVISKQSLINQIVQLIYIQPGTEIATNILCQTTPILETLKLITCDCLSGYSSLDICKSTSFVSYQIGSELFCYGNEKNVRVGSVNLGMYTNSVPLSLYCINMQIFSHGVSQFQNHDIVSSSALLASLSFKNNPYAVIKNKYNYIVGQLLADGIGINITKSTLVGSSATPNTRSTSTSNNTFLLCMDQRKDVEYAFGDFPLLDFASTVDYKTWTPLKLNVTLVNGQYCGLVSTTTNLIFPVALSKDWQTRNSIFANNKDVQNVLYFLAAFMFLLFGGSFFFFWFHYYINPHFSLAKVSLILIAAYSGLRGVYFLLFALDKLNGISNNNPAGFFCLAELPYYLFLSIFIILIIFWSKISKTTARNFSKKMFVPTLVLLLLLYAFFAAVCIVAAVVKGQSATILNKVYKSIVAAIAFIIIICAWIYGGYVIRVSYRGMKLKKKTTSDILFKTTVVLVISSLALLFQIIYLLYVTFAKTPSVGFSVAVYFLVEAIPAFCLFLLFFPIKTEAKVSRTMSRKSGKSHASNKNDREFEKESVEIEKLSPKKKFIN